MAGVGGTDIILILWWGEGIGWLGALELWSFGSWRTSCQFEV